MTIAERGWGAGRGEFTEKQLATLIERCSRNGEVYPDEVEPSYMESVCRYNASTCEQMRAAWCEYHQGQAARHRAILASLEQSVTVAADGESAA